MLVEKFLDVLQDSLGSITDPRFFNTERGYQGALVSELSRRLGEIPIGPGNPIVEQEYQKRASEHHITIRPDIIIHIPFEREATPSRSHGNYVAIELNLRANPHEAAEDYENLRQLVEVLNYEIAIFINIDSNQSHAATCPASITGRTHSYAVSLQNGAVLITK